MSSLASDYTMSTIGKFNLCLMVVQDRSLQGDVHTVHPWLARNYMQLQCTSMELRGLLLADCEGKLPCRASVRGGGSDILAYQENFCKDPAEWVDCESVGLVAFEDQEEESVQCRERQNKVVHDGLSKEGKIPHEEAGGVVQSVRGSLLA